MKNRPLDPIYGYIKLCEIGQCVSVETDKPAYMQRVCFIANKMFANEGKRFTSRYDKAKGIGYVWRIEPGSKYDYNIHKK